MFKTLATGMLTRRMARGVSRRTSNPFLRAAGVAGAGLLASRLLRGSGKSRRRRRGGLLGRFM